MGLPNVFAYAVRGNEESQGFNAIDRLRNRDEPTSLDD
jgi:hypothetical protein